MPRRKPGDKGAPAGSPVPLPGGSPAEGAPPPVDPAANPPAATAAARAAADTPASIDVPASADTPASTDAPAAAPAPADAPKPGETYNLSGDFRYAVVNIQSTIVGAETVRDIEDLPPEAGPAPYLGLNYFTEQDADHFFGREQLTAKLVGLLDQWRFLAVLAASGSGKSSLLRAGVIPALARGVALADGSLPPANSARWLSRVFTPTAHPLASLAAALTPGPDPSGAGAETLAQALRADPAALPRAARALMAPTAAPDLLLVVDQFEEVFTQTRDEAERLAFITALLAAVDPANPQPIHLVILLRADFYASLAPYDRLRELASTQQAFIGAMSREELTRAILMPAALGSWKIQAGLVEQMLDDTGSEPGALPLLSHALLETWNRRRGRTLTLSGYRESGGVRGALAQTAEAVFRSRLTPAQQIVARMIFLRLVDVEDGAPETRRRAAFSELITRASDPLVIDAVIGILTDARLLTTGLEEPGDVRVIEVAHEALIREWPTLRQWLTEDRAGLILHRQLTEAAADWQRLARDPGALYRGARLKAAAAWAAANPDDLSTAEADFLTASQAAEQAEIERDRQLKRSQLMRRLIFPVASVAALALLGVLIYVSGFYVRFLTPAKMSGVYNVAVAEFGQIGPDGQTGPAQGDAGRLISGWVAGDLRAQLAGDSKFQVWRDGPEIARQNVTIGRVDGSTPAARQQAAQALAARLGAQMVVFGQIDTRQSPARVQMEFWLVPQAGYDFTELRGSYQVAGPVIVADPAHPGIEAQPQLTAQSNAVAWLALGLARMRFGQSPEALDAFRRAETFTPDSAAVQFFIGRESLFLSDRDPVHQAELTAAAEKAFARAVRLDPTDAEALIGQGAVYFAQAKRLVGAVQSAPGPDAPDQLTQAVKLIDQAAAAYRQALALPAADKLPGLAADPSARLGLGGALRLQGEAQYRAGQTGPARRSLDDAVLELEDIIQPLQAENQERLLAQTYQTLGTAYQWIGFLDETANDPSGGQAAYTRAVQAYDRCAGLGSVSTDRIVREDIAAKLCVPYRDDVQKRLDLLSGGS